MKVNDQSFAVLHKLESARRNCHLNETLYKVLKLQNLYDVTTLRKYAGRYDINNTIQQLRRKISLSPGVVILTDSAKSKLNDLAQSGLSDIKFYQYAEILADNITNINLKHLSSQLRDVSSKLPEGQEDIRISLEKNAHDLEHYHRDLVMPMATLSEQLSEKALTLQENIKFNHTSMAEAIHDLVDEVTKAQQFLNKDGPEYVQHVSLFDFCTTFMGLLKFGVPSLPTSFLPIFRPDLQSFIPHVPFDETIVLFLSLLLAACKV